MTSSAGFPRSWPGSHSRAGCLASLGILGIRQAGVSGDSPAALPVPSRVRHQVEALLDGLDIIRLEETERDGHAFSGPKHWHTFDILARKPISKRPSAPASSP
jgi:hypothetical protein